MTHPAADLHKAAQQALEALSLALSDVDWQKDSPTQPVIHKAYNALREALAKPAVPPGYALVPVEPTPEMCQQGVACADREWAYFVSRNDSKKLWCAMLAVAPKPKDKP